MGYDTKSNIGPQNTDGAVSKNISINNDTKSMSINNDNKSMSIDNDSKSMSINNDSKLMSINNDVNLISISNDDKSMSVNNDTKVMSISNQSRRSKLSLLDYNRFGYNTVIDGVAGEISEAYGCDTTKESGRIQSGNTLDVTSNADYDTIALNESITMDKVYQIMQVSGFSELATDDIELSNISSLRMVLPTFAYDDYHILDQPILFSWKLVTFHDSAGEIEKRVLAFGPLFIPYIRLHNQLHGIYGIYREDKCIVNNNITMNRMLISNGGPIDMPPTDTLSGSQTWGFSVGSQSVLESMKLKYSVTGFYESSIDISMSVSASRFNTSKDTLKNGTSYINYDGLAAGNLFNQDLINPGQPRIYGMSIKFNYRILESDELKSANILFTHPYLYHNSKETTSGYLIYAIYDTGKYDTFGHRIYLYNTDSHASDYWRTLRNVTMSADELPAGVSIDITLNDVRQTLTSDTVDNTTANKAINKENCYICSDTDDITDPLLEVENAGSVASVNTNAYKVTSTSDVTVLLDINNISSASLINENGVSVDSGVCLANIIGVQSTNGDDVTRSNVDIVVDNEAISGPLSFNALSTISKISKLSNRYMLTYVNAGETKYFGVYDTLLDKYYSPTNLQLYSEYLPTSFNVDNINIITDSNYDLSFIIEFDDKKLYYSIVRADSFSGSRLFEDDVYRANTVLSIIPIDNGVLIDNDRKFNLVQNWNNIKWANTTETKKTSIALMCGNSDISYMKDGISTIDLGSGYDVLGFSTNFVTNNLMVIQDSIQMVTNTISFPNILPTCLILSPTGDTIDDDAHYVNNLDYTPAQFYFKKLMGYNWGHSGSFGTMDDELTPSTGTTILCKTPAIDSENNYIVLPYKLIDIVGVEDVSLLGVCGNDVLAIANSSFSIFNKNIYESSKYKLVPKTNKALLDIYGDIRTIGNIVSISNDGATTLYSISKNGDISYMLGIPDTLTSNIVSMNQLLLAAGKTGLYLIKQSGYEKIYSFDRTREHAIIRAIDGKDFVVYCYNNTDTEIPFECTDGTLECTNGYLLVNSIIGEFNTYRVNQSLHVIEINTNSELTNYNVINNNKPVTDDITIIGNESTDVKVLDFTFTKSDYTFTTRPIHVAVSSDADFTANGIKIYHKGYGDINVNITDGSNTIATYTKTINGSDLDVLSKTSIDITPIIIDYTKIIYTVDSTLCIDRIEAIGYYSKL